MWLQMQERGKSIQPSVIAQGSSGIRASPARRSPARTRGSSSAGDPERSNGQGRADKRPLAVLLMVAAGNVIIWRRFLAAHETACFLERDLDVARRTLWVAVL
jgi:hypothetical protein